MKSLHMRFIARIKKEDPPRSSMLNFNTQAWRSSGYGIDHVIKNNRLQYSVATRIFSFSHTLKVKVLLVKYSNNFEYLMFLPQITINFLNVFIIGQ